MQCRLYCGQPMEVVSLRRSLALMALASVGLTGCPNKSCEDDADPEIILGQGASSAFLPFEDGEAVPLSVAPQGGMGINIRARTRGLTTEELVSLELLTEIDGEETGRFETTGIFTCQDDGFGLLWGQVVGFDPAEYPDVDALLELDGQLVDVVVIARDVDGTEVEGRATVTLEVAR